MATCEECGGIMEDGAAFIVLFDTPGAPKGDWSERWTCGQECAERAARRFPSALIVTPDDGDERGADERDDRDGGPVEFTESDEGREALDAWARRYDERDGAPEGDWDR